ncbi:MAG: methyltransferase domain-containing protein [Candidatus Saccharibacteria bacterium]
MARFLRILNRLLMLDKNYWDAIPARMVSMTRRLYNTIIDYIYIGESLVEIVHSEELKASGANQTQSAEYLALIHAFGKIEMSESDVVVDVGCGRGRAIIWLLKNRKVAKIYGVELNDKVAQQTAKRFAKYNNVDIINGDALESIPQEATVFYLYNPFVGSIVLRYKEKLEELFYTKKSITIVYHNPIYLKVFLNDPKWTIEFYRYEPEFIRKLLRFRQQDTAIITLKHQ